jgi:basic amino acid/polyamine antiporter, APA family
MAVSDHAAPPEGVGGEGLFVRKSSGLVRELGTRELIGMGFGGVSLIGLFAVTPIFLQAFPNGDFYVPLIIGFVVSLLLALAYTQMVGVFPKSGGEYVWTSRTFGPLLGAVMGGAVLIVVCLNSATSIVLITQISVPFAFTTIGQTLHIGALTDFGTKSLVGHTGWIICGLVVTALYALIGLRPIHTVAKWIFWSFVGGVVGYFMIVVLLLLQGHTAFVHDFNAASGANAYNNIIAQSRASGFVPGITTAAVVALIPLGAVSYANFTYGNYTAGEMKRPLRTYKVAVMSILVMALLSLMLGWFALRHTVGLSFMQSSVALSAANPSKYSALSPIPALQGGLAYGIVASGDPVTKLIIAIGQLAGAFCTGLMIFAVASRIIFALSFDRLLPTKLADVHERTHAPVYAVALTTFGVGLFALLGNATSILSIFRNLLLIALAIFAVGSLCCAFVPFRRKALFDAAPKLFEGRVLGVPLVSLIGLAAAASFVALDVDLATKPAYSGGFSTSSILTIIAIVTAGLVAYAISRVVLSRRGIDVRLAMAELPPE